MITRRATPLPSPSPFDNPETSNPDGQDQSQDNDSTNVGAIAGGTVGGVVGLSLVAALLWFLRRHKKRKQQPSAGNMSTTPIPDETKTVRERGNGVVEMESQSPVDHTLAELQESRIRHELP